MEARKSKPCAAGEKFSLTLELASGVSYSTAIIVEFKGPMDYQEAEQISFTTNTSSVGDGDPMTECRLTGVVPKDAPFGIYRLVRLSAVQGGEATTEAKEMPLTHEYYLSVQKQRIEPPDVPQVKGIR